MPSTRIWLVAALGLTTLTVAAQAGGPVVATSPVVTQVDLTGPAGSERFGEEVLVLSNGNYVVVDSGFDDGATADVGAVYLFDGATNSIISTLTGSQAGDEVGSRGVIEVGDSNVVVLSPEWNGATANDVGAATWMDGTTGIDGVVSVSNSLHGTTMADQVGRTTIVLTTGDYVVGSSAWTDPAGPTPNAGAATWADGNNGLAGPVTVINSLHGTTSGDAVGARLRALTNGNYVVTSPAWDDPAGPTANVGAATWVDGSTGLTGPVTVANSLHGTTAGDQVGGFVAALANGNYVVPSSLWDDPAGPTANVGAATWVDGSTGLTGPVTVANSLHGTTAQDEVGLDVVALTNGNYVVRSEFWDDPAGPTVDVGAATWADGTIGLSGPVTTVNSLHGSTADDQVGDRLRPLANGNYVVGSPVWDDPAGPTVDVGAATWADGTGGLSGPVTTVNSLHGTAAADGVGTRLFTLANGNYVVASPLWDDPAGPTVDVGAATWADGTGGLRGAVTVANSLHGSTADDQVGGRAAGLTNGDYVIASPRWDNGTVVDAGAATWGDGAAGLTGPVTSANSLHGSTTDDAVGERGVTALESGDYVVTSRRWDDSSTVDAGAVTLGTKESGVTGPVTSSNSVIGTPPGAIESPDGTLTAGAAVVVPTEQNRVLLMQLELFDVVAVVPERILETREGLDTIDGEFEGIGRVGAGSEVELEVAGRGGVPGDATAAFLNVTAIRPDARGFLTVYPCDAQRPVTSSVNYAAGSIEPNAVLAKLSATGTVCIWSLRSTDLIADTAGYLPVNSTTRPVVPERILETREGLDTIDGEFEGIGRVGAGSEVELEVAGRGGVPGDATAAFLNVTAIRPDARGFLTVYPCDAQRPVTSSVNYAAGSIEPNAVLAKLSATGTVCIWSLRSTDLIADTAGYLPVNSTTRPVVPERILETREGLDTIDGEFEGIGRVGAGSEVELEVAGRGGVPGDATAAFLNVTAIRPDARGFLTVYPCDAQRPVTSSVNYAAGSIEPNAVLAKLSATGTVCIWSLRSTDLIADTAGYVPG